MYVVPGVVGVPSLSQIAAWDIEHLEGAAHDWTATGKHWEDAFTSVHRGTLSPGGTVWVGDAAEAARERTYDDLVKVRGWADVLHRAADVARQGATTLHYSQRSVLNAVEDARAAGFIVGEDLSVTSQLTGGSPVQQVARHVQAQQLAADIQLRAAQLAADDKRIAAKITTTTAPLHAVTFRETPSPSAATTASNLTDTPQHTAGAEPAVSSVVTDDTRSSADLSRAGDQVSTSQPYHGYAATMPPVAPARSTGGVPSAGVGSGFSPVLGSLMPPPVASPAPSPGAAPAPTPTAHPLASAQPQPPPPAPPPQAHAADPRHAQPVAPIPQPRLFTEPPQAQPSAPATSAAPPVAVVRGSAPVNAEAANLTGFPFQPHPQPRNGSIQAVDSHTFKQDPQLSGPDDPNDNEPDPAKREAKKEWAKVNAEIDAWNARCGVQRGRPFLLPAEQGEVDACVAERGQLLRRQAAARARLNDLGIPIRGEEPPAPPTEPQPPPPSAGEPPVPHSPKRVVGPHGEHLPGVPPGESPTGPADSGRGSIFSIAPGQPGIDPRVTSIRVMEPTDQYPNGYAVYMNAQG